MQKVISSFKKKYIRLYLLKDNNKGQGMFEYALILAIMGLGVIVALSGASDEILETINRFITELQNASP